VVVRRVDRGLEVEPEVDVAEEDVERPLILLVPARVPVARYGSPPRAAIVGESVVRGRFPGSSEFGRPSSSQNICARVPRGSRATG
jgi:hypothetical protein